MAEYGWDIEGSGINPNLFCRIYAVKRSGSRAGIPSYMQGVSVVGKIVSSSLTSTGNWESALEGKSADTAFSSTSALLQTGEASKILGDSLAEFTNKYVGKTMIGISESYQVWRGEEPLSASLTLEFLAIRDPIKEVELPIKYLHLFKTPFLRQGLLQNISNIGIGFNIDERLLGDVPFDVNVSIYNKKFNATYVVESVDESEEEVRRDKNGNRLQQEVSLNLKSVRSINRGATLATTDILI